MSACEQVFLVGSRVEVDGFGVGMIVMDNEDGTWNVELDNGDECDVPPSALTLAQDQSIDELRSHTSGWPRDLRSGIRIIADASAPLSKEFTRIVCFSDTHGRHNAIPTQNLPEADILLHAGDFTNTGEIEQIESFNQWLKEYPAKHKIVIAGNHDTTLDREYYEDRGGDRFHKGNQYDCEVARAMLKDCIYLENESVEVMGYSIYGSPYTPAFCDWAFNLERGAECFEAWELIPGNVDILMTHGPPRGFGDRSGEKRVGCEELLHCVQKWSVPLHVFGHIHSSYGCTTDDHTLFVNASTCNHNYSPINPPVILDIPPPTELQNAAKLPSKKKDTYVDMI